MKIEITSATEADIDEMAPRLRAADRAEVWASSMQSPEEVLRSAIAVSPNALTGRINGEIVCMYGVAETSMMTPDHGRPWLLSTDALNDRAVGIAFARRNRPWLRRMLTDYTMLSNYCDTRNTVALKWLDWCGFHFEETVPMGPFLMPFVKFVMRRS